MIPLIYINNMRVRIREGCIRERVPGSKERIGGEMREKEIERYLVDRAVAMGGMALKFVSPGCTGVPDRLVVLPGGRIGFLELKAPGKKPRREQAYRIARLRALGCLADSADSREDVDLFLASLSSGIPVPARTRGLPGTEGRP